MEKWLEEKFKDLLNRGLRRPLRSSSSMLQKNVSQDEVHQFLACLLSHMMPFDSFLLRNSFLCERFDRPTHSKLSFRLLALHLLRVNLLRIDAANLADYDGIVSELACFVK